MNVPVVYDRYSNTYAIHRPVGKGLASSQRQELPGVWFSQQEIVARRTMYQLIASLDAAGMLQRHLQPILQRLNTMLGSTRATGLGADRASRHERGRALGWRHGAVLSVVVRSCHRQPRTESVPPKRSPAHYLWASRNGIWRRKRHLPLMPISASTGDRTNRRLRLALG